MSRYFDTPVQRGECVARPRHVVMYRTYQLCGNPQNIGTYRHCSDEHASPMPNVVFGSSKTRGPCPTCANPQNIRIIVRLNPHRQTNKGQQLTFYLSLAIHERMTGCATETLIMGSAVEWHVALTWRVPT